MQSKPNFLIRDCSTKIQTTKGTDYRDSKLSFSIHSSYKPKATAYQFICQNQNLIPVSTVMLQR